jgi:hypothetical protein
MAKWYFWLSAKTQTILWRVYSAIISNGNAKPWLLFVAARIRLNTPRKRVLRHRWYQLN